MTIDIPVLIVFLTKIHLCRGMTKEQLEAVAESLTSEKSCEPGEVVIQEGQAGDEFFMIYRGKVEVTHRDKDRKPKTLAALVAGDYFGEEALLTRGRRTATVTAKEPTLLLVLSRHKFDELLKVIPKLRQNLEMAASSRKLARQTQFKWLQEGEVIYFLARKHPILLWKSLIWPVVGLILLLVIFVCYLLMPSVTLLVMEGIGLLFILGWIVWNYIDWTNDYCIVTNRRAIWLEKVVGLYDSRQEAPLTTVLSVGVETGQVGRMMDFGDVVVRTFVGKILFNDVHRPYQAASLIEEHWTRSREATRKADASAMQQAIREKLGLAQPQPPLTSDAQVVSPIIKRPNVLKLLFANIFKVRFEESGGVITYRKHIFVLVMQTWLPGLILILLLTGLVYRLFHLPQSAPGAPPRGADALVVLLLISLLVVFLWWLYQYIDWRNDKFQVTQDQIFDIDRTPLGREERKAAALENILSTEYRRIGLLQVLLNYGNVYITVGGTQMVFENVANPPAVQQDIDQRRIALREKQEQNRITGERDRLAEFFAQYHTNADEYQHELEARKQNQAGQDQNPEPPDLE